MTGNISFLPESCEAPFLLLLNERGKSEIFGIFGIVWSLSTICKLTSPLKFSIVMICDKLPISVWTKEQCYNL